MRQRAVFNRPAVMQKTAVVGLGIIGGSICASLTAAGYYVAGTDLDGSALSVALQRGFVREKAENFSDYKTVILAVPVRAAISVLTAGKFQDGALVADVCGVKKAVEEAVYALPRNYRYIGLHPMAGKETSGISSASADLFRGANLVMTVCPQTLESACREIAEYAKAMGFGRIVTCTAEEHDRKIALTSQLAHIVSNAYVKSPEVDGCEGFTGGSFQDMTRIAGVDEIMWSELYLANRGNLLAELDSLIGHLSEYREALADGDEEKLRQKLREGRRRRECIRRGND